VVKILDFGLAKAAEEPPGDAEHSPTLTISPTRAGLILGTAAYLSPEQARGKPLFITGTNVPAKHGLFAGAMARGFGFMGIQAA
jgi:serine/threonine protein kinase